jgi:hypothetical protein
MHMIVCALLRQVAGLCVQIRKYEASLKLLNSDTPLAAREMLYELLEHPIVHQVTFLVLMYYVVNSFAWKLIGLCALQAKTQPVAKSKAANHPNPPQTQRLVYLVLKHLADVEAMYVEQAMANGGNPDTQKALALYSDALNLDASDAQLWLKFGRAAVTAKAPAIARLAFEHGLKQHHNHPLLCEELLQILIQVQPLILWLL